MNGRKIADFRHRAKSKRAEMAESAPLLPAFLGKIDLTSLSSFQPLQSEPLPRIKQLSLEQPDRGSHPQAATAGD